MAALRKHADVAVGNVLGSNIFNLLAILGISALVEPLPLAQRIQSFDQWAMLGAAVLLVLFLLKKQQLTRLAGITFLFGLCRLCLGQFCCLRLTSVVLTAGFGQTRVCIGGQLMVATVARWSGVVLSSAVLMFTVLSASGLQAQGSAEVLAAASAQKQGLITTLEQLVSIESGSGDREGLDQLAELIAERLRDLGGEVELLEAGPDVYRMFDTPEQIGRMVHARFMGSGDKKILLLAHMDTVYLRGMIAEQPFRIDGNRAYGLGISDDKQGVAVILHTIAMLNEMGFDDYGTLTVLDQR